MEVEPLGWSMVATDMSAVVCFDRDEGLGLSLALEIRVGTSDLSVELI